jgi:hypothetical protein
MTEDLEWVKVNEITDTCIALTEYEDTTGTYCKQVWSDGYEEIFEIAK